MMKNYLLAFWLEKKIFILVFIFVSILGIIFGKIYWEKSVIFKVQQEKELQEKMAKKEKQAKYEAAYFGRIAEQKKHENDLKRLAEYKKSKRKNESEKLFNERMKRNELKLKEEEKKYKEELKIRKLSQEILDKEMKKLGLARKKNKERLRLKDEDIMRVYGERTAEYREAKRLAEENRIKKIYKRKRVGDKAQKVSDKRVLDRQN